MKWSHHLQSQSLAVHIRKAQIFTTWYTLQSITRCLSNLRIFTLCSGSQPITGAKSFIVGRRNEFPALWLPSNLFFIVFLNPAPSSWICFGVKLIYFWQLLLGLWHVSCNFKTVHFFFKAHLADILIADQCQCFYFAFIIKFPPLVIYSVKICDLFRPQTPQNPLIILTSFLVLGPIFSYSTKLLLFE